MTRAKQCEASDAKHTDVCEQRATKQCAGYRQSGGLAQLGEHLLCKQGVVGSIPSSSTNYLVIKPDSDRHLSLNTKAVSQETVLLLIPDSRINAAVL